MNVKRFTGRSSREAMNQVRLAFGDDAVLLSTKPCAEGIEVLAMAADGVQQIERVAAAAPAPAPAPAVVSPRLERPAASASPVGEDVEQLAMSTLSFQDYVRERMLRRRQAALKGEPATPEAAPAPSVQPPPEPAVVPMPVRQAQPAPPLRATPAAEPDIDFAALDAVRVPRMPAPPRDLNPLRADVQAMDLHTPAPAPDLRREQHDMMAELRSMKGLIEERFGALAFMEKLQRQPAQARLTQKLLDCGFSPALIRKLAEGMPADVADESTWAGNVLQRNLLTGEADAALEDLGGVYAMVGPTGVGKTTSTAKLAAAFATRHGSANLGLITLDAYRVAAHEQLRAYGRILGVPVHTAHDRASLEDLLDLLSGKKMVLIDTAGMAQRDSRTRELLDMLSHRAIQRLLVVNAASQGETIEDVVISYRGASCHGIVLSKMDEAVKLGPALDALIRHRLKVVAVANGQRVPEDWHRLSAQALVQRALRAAGGSAWRMDAGDVSLVFTALPGGHAAGSAAMAAH